jgi:CheY-like chemotaxis protein
MEDGRKKSPGESKIVLLVEDARDVRLLLSEFLARNGYTVLSAENGREAIEASRQHAGPIELLLTDVVMPGMSGQELACHLTTERPETRVLYISGYALETIIKFGALQPTASLLQKPFTLDALARKVRDVLEQPRS